MCMHMSMIIAMARRLLKVIDTSIQRGSEAIRSALAAIRNRIDTITRKNRTIISMHTAITIMDMTTLMTIRMLRRLSSIR